VILCSRAKCRSAFNFVMRTALSCPAALRCAYQGRRGLQASPSRAANLHMRPMIRIGTCPQPSKEAYDEIAAAKSPRLLFAAVCKRALRTEHGASASDVCAGLAARAGGSNRQRRSQPLSTGAWARLEAAWPIRVAVATGIYSDHDHGTFLNTFVPIIMGTRTPVDSGVGDSESRAAAGLGLRRAPNEP
jgi:hypothetical protein